MAYISNEDTSIFPYNDGDMKYDDSLHMYILTKEAIKNRFGHNIDTLTPNAEELLLEISYDIYTHIMHSTFMSERWKKEYYLAKDDTLRPVIKEALLSHYRYGYRSGGIVLKDQHGVDFGKGKQTMFGDVSISRYTHSLLEKEGLLYTGQMKYLNRSLYRVGY